MDKGSPPWRVTTLGKLRLWRGGEPLDPPGTRKAHLLLAYLAYYLGRPQPREELRDLLWPESDLSKSRNSLNNALSGLRGALEPRGVPPGSVLKGSHAEVCLRAGAVATDLAEMEAARRAACTATHPDDRVPHWQRVATLYQGTFLPGFYEDWVLAARLPIEAAYREAVQSLVKTLGEAGELDGAIHYAEEALRRIPDWEQVHEDLIRLYFAVGLPTTALGHYEALKRLLGEVGEVPAPALWEQAGQWRQERATTWMPPLPPSKSVLPIILPDLPLTPLGSNPSSRLFGREADLARLRVLLDPPRLPPSATMHPPPPRLITLAGPAGVGKTRLAQEAAARRPAPMGHTLFVPLAPLTDAALIPKAVVTLLGLTSKEDPLAQVLEHLAEQPTLLILDNLEHLLPDAGAFVSLLLERLPSLTCLVTSRRRTGLPGEQEVPVETLPVPADQGLDQNGPPLETLQGFASAQLFVARAQAVRPSFALTTGNAASVAALCRRLEGLPLALELAAAWARVLTPAQMLPRLSRRFDLLVSDSPDADPRHASLSAALGWSFRLLGPDVQEFLAGLSVFRGGWTLGAAEAVRREPLALKYLSHLREQSLLSAEEAGEEMRFTMLESVREFAASQLTVSEWHAARERHAAFFLALAEEAAPHLTGENQSLWLQRLAQEQDNLGAALDWYSDTGADHSGEGEGAESHVGQEGSGDDNGLRLGTALGEFWLRTGGFVEGHRRLVALLAYAEAPTLLRAKALTVAGNLIRSQGDYAAARTLFGQARDIGGRLHDLPTLAASLNNLGLVAQHLGEREQARALYLESLELDRQRGNLAGVAKSYHNLGNLAYSGCDYSQTQHDWEEALAHYCRCGDDYGRAGVLNNLGLVLRDTGDFPAARRRHQEALEIAHALGNNEQLIAFTLNNLGVIADYEGDLDQARVLYEESLALKQKLNLRKSVGITLANLGNIARRQGNHAAARRCLRESLDIKWDGKDAQGTALDLELFGLLAHDEGDDEQALHLFGCAEALREQIGLPRLGPECRELHAALKALEAEMGSERFARLQAQGREVPVEKAVQASLSLLRSPPAPP